MKQATYVLFLSLFSIQGAGARAQGEPLPAQWIWRNLTPPLGPAPEPRSAGTAIYDPIGRRVVIFGGRVDGRVFNDVWAFDLVTQSWTRLETSGRQPEPRLGANAVYDPNAHQMVLWAGQQGSVFYNDTWTLDLTTLEWRDVSPRAADRPQARYGAGAVFDPVERRLVQFAGFTDLSRRFNDTQAFDLDTNRWEGLDLASGRPEIRCLLTAALDAPSRRMVIHGGQRSGPLGDTWAFDLATRSWQNLTPETRPAGRMLAVSFIDRDARFIVFGGSTEAGRVNETWAFNLVNGEWTQLEIESPPAPREAPMGAYIEDEDRFIVVGGVGDGPLNDVWELRRAPGPTSAR